MSTEKIELALRAANPVGKQALAALDLAAGEAELGRALVAESALSGEPIAREVAARRSRSAWLLIAGGVAAAATAVVLLLAPGGASPSPERCATSLRSAVHTTRARAASLKARMLISTRRTSGCTMIGSAGLSGDLAPVSERPCNRSRA